MRDKMNIYIVGVGGQGVLTIADIIAVAAAKKNISINYYPTKGMAQRGGFVKAQIRLGDELNAPEIAPYTADLAISMELSETLRAIEYVKKGGDLICMANRWQPTDVMLGRADYPTVETVSSYAEKAGLVSGFILPEKITEDVAANIVLLACACKNTCLGEMFTKQELTDAMLTKFSKGTERNLLSFETGYCYTF